MFKNFQWLPVSLSEKANPFVMAYVLCCAKMLSRVWLFATPWSVDRQGPLSMGFSRQEYWSGLPYPPPGNLPDPGIEPTALTSPALSGRFFTTSATWEASNTRIDTKIILKQQHKTWIMFRILLGRMWSTFRNFFRTYYN